MSLRFDNPFVDIPATNLNLLAGVASSLFGGRVLMSAMEHVSQEQPDIVYPHKPSQTKTKVKMKVGKSKANRKVATVASVKRMISGVLEKKQCPIAQNTNIVVGSNDSIWTQNMTAQIVQGTVDGARVGDEIHLNSLHFNGQFLTDEVSGFYRYRLLVGWSGEEFNPSGGALSTSGLASNQLFVQGVSENVTGVVNTKAFTPILDVTYDINSQITSVIDGKTFRHVVPLNQKFKYQQSSGAGNVYGKTKNLYMVIVVKWITDSAPATNGSIINQSIVVKYTDA